jgi:hypothetical protein
MTRSIIHQCIAYLLIAFLPLQAIAAGHLALCAESSAAMTKSGAQTMADCSQMTSMQQSSSLESTTAHNNSACWLGSICVASVGMIAVPSHYQFIHIEHSAPIYFSTTALYLSITPDTPQRPPTTL